MPPERGGRRVGLMVDRDWPPEELIPACRRLDRTAIDDVWVVEDLEWAGSISQAAVALTVTETLRVGIGIAPAPYRNAALLAMELATLARIHPDRLVAGVGHGVPEWVDKAGAARPSPVTLLEDTIAAVRALLHGETVSLDGREVRLDGVRLVHPPSSPPPVLAGVIRPRSLEAAGRVADGLILIEGTTPRLLRDALAHAENGRAAGRPGAPIDVVVFTHVCVDDDAERAASVARPALEEIAEFIGADVGDVGAGVGPPEAAARWVEELWDAGAGTVVLHVLGDRPLEQVERLLSALGR